MDLLLIQALSALRVISFISASFHLMASSKRQHLSLYCRVSNKEVHNCLKSPIMQEEEVSAFKTSSHHTPTSNPEHAEEPQKQEYCSQR
jgi:hypothetical protein